MTAEENFRKERIRFEKLLDAVIINDVSPENYCRKYLRHLIEHKKYYLAIYADVLSKLIAHSNKKKEEIVLIDLGAGNGLLGIFAKFCGFNKVFINDIDGKFIEASKKLSIQMHIHIDAFILGDIHLIKTYCQHSKPDAVIGTDVIEHIYDLKDFFKTIAEINPLIVTVFTTASNPKNYFKVKQLKKLQLKDEYKGGQPDDFVLFGESALEPFFEIRKRIIREQLPGSTEEIITAFAKATRGMNRADILASITRYRTTQAISIPPIHPTNTCNPLNSSWTERILEFDDYYSIYNSNGMKLEIYNGFYNGYKKAVKGFLNKLLNMAVKAIGSHFAPFVIFVGTKK